MKNSNGLTNEAVPTAGFENIDELFSLLENSGIEIYTRQEGENQERDVRIARLGNGTEIKAFDYNGNSPRVGRQEIEISPIQTEDGITLFKMVGIVTKQSKNQNEPWFPTTYKSGGQNQYPDEIANRIERELEIPKTDEDISSKIDKFKGITIESMMRPFDNGSYFHTLKTITDKGVTEIWTNMYLGKDHDYIIPIHDARNNPVAEIRLGIKYCLKYDPSTEKGDIADKNRLSTGHRYTDIANIAIINLCPGTDS